MIIAIWAYPYINVKKPHIGLYKSYSNVNRMNIRVLEKQSNFISKISTSPSESGPTHLDGREYPSLLQVVSNEPSTTGT